jgi:hypothetical protein
MISGLGDRLRVDVLRPDGSVVRIERDADAVPASTEECDSAERRIERRMQMADPGRRWSGPPIPSRKQAFTGLFAGTDSRIWMRPSPAVAEGTPSRILFDVYQADGRYLGEVNAPAGLVSYPPPASERGTSGR